MLLNLTASIVLFQNDILSLRNTILSVLNNKELNLKLFLIDNSPNKGLMNVLSEFLKDNRVEYIYTKNNLGFGAGHNLAIKKIINASPYHLILNPDVEFEQDVLKDILLFMDNDIKIGQLMPKVYYKDGQLQKLCNPLPKPINLLSRRFFLHTKWAQQLNYEYELRDFNYNSILNVPNLSGCFMFLRNEVLKKVGFFDERYFMYMEDVDLCRRIHAISKTIFYPETSIIHGFEKKSYSNKNLLKHHMASAFKYFNKWGWILDKQRDEFNKKLLKEVSNQQDQLQLNS